MRVHSYKVLPPVFSMFTFLFLFSSSISFDVGAKVLVYYDSRYQNYLAFTLTEALYFVHFPGAKDPEFFPGNNLLVKTKTWLVSDKLFVNRSTD